MNNIFIKTLPSEIYSGYILAWSLSLPTIWCVAAAEAWDSTGLTMPPWTQCEPSCFRYRVTLRTCWPSALLNYRSWLDFSVRSPAPQSLHHRALSDTGWILSPVIQENQPSCHCCVPSARVPGARVSDAQVPNVWGLNAWCPVPKYPSDPVVDAQVPSAQCQSAQCPSAQLRCTGRSWGPAGLQWRLSSGVMSAENHGLIGSGHIPWRPQNVERESGNIPIIVCREWPWEWLKAGGKKK